VDGMAAVGAVQLGLQSVWAVTDVLQVTLVCCFSGFIHHSSGAVHLITLLTCAWLQHLTQYCRMSPASCWSHKSRLQVVGSDSCVSYCCLASVVLMLRLDSVDDMLVLLPPLCFSVGHVIRKHVLLGSLWGLPGSNCSRSALPSAERQICAAHTARHQQPLSRPVGCVGALQAEVNPGTNGFVEGHRGWRRSW
jgi:hypothetical protein